VELRHLRYFVAVAEELHFRKAAERLHISQPPLSHQIGLLEKEVGLKLLERTNRRVSLTPAGELFLQEARATLEQAGKASSVATRYRAGEIGELRLNFFPSALLIGTVSRSVLHFRRRFPEISLVLTERESQDQVVAIAKDDADIAVIRSYGPPLIPSQLQSQLLVEEPVFVVMPDDHPLSKTASLKAEQLQDELIIAYGDRMGTTLPRIVRDVCRQAGFEPEYSQVANANTTMVGLVALGLGLAIVPEAQARMLPIGVVAKPLPDSTPKASVSLVWKRRADTPPVIENFLTLLRDVSGIGGTIP
jgi:DNA-binding transcriptional LysR family regulator